MMGKRELTKKEKIEATHFKAKEILMARARNLKLLVFAVAALIRFGSDKPDEREFIKYGLMIPVSAGILGSELARRLNQRRCNEILRKSIPKPVLPAVKPDLSRVMSPVRVFHL